MLEYNRTITFGGQVIPARIASTPKIIRATRKMTARQIAGSNREVIEMEKAWECYEQPYSLFLGDGTEDSVQPLVDAVAVVLYQDGWKVLLDDYEPDYYRLAYYQGGFEVDNRYTRLGRFDIVFRCRPERFLIAGDAPVNVPSGESINNPTAFEAKPLIRITGSGNGTLTVNDTTMSFTDILDYLVIDCETMNVYRQEGENRNSLMTGDFPVLTPGENIVAFTGGISSAIITPKWWTI